MRRNDNRKDRNSSLPFRVKGRGEEMILEREEPTKGGQKSSGSWAGRITKCLGEAEAAVAQGRGGRRKKLSLEHCQSPPPPPCFDV